VVPVEVPSSHCVETRLTHVPTEEQREVLADLGVQLKYKKFTPYEDSIICKNWERFSRVIVFHMTFVPNVSQVSNIKMIYFVTGVWF
jgi:hypothetical protein